MYHPTSGFAIMSIGTRAESHVIMDANMEVDVAATPMIRLIAY